MLQSDNQLKGYVHVDFVGNVDGGKSTSVYVFEFSRRAINWTNNKKEVISQSTTKANYIVVAEATKEAM